MSRRRVRPRTGGDFPAPLAEFDPADWWVGDLEDPLEVGYARVLWHVARSAYTEGGDWEAHLQPPAWLQPESPRPVAMDSAYTSTVPDDRTPGPLPTLPDLHEWRTDGA